MWLFGPFRGKGAVQDFANFREAKAFIERMTCVETKKEGTTMPRLRKAASSNLVTGGALDLLYSLEQEDNPEAAAEVLLHSLRSRSSGTAFDALTVWDIVASSPHEEYAAVFRMRFVRDAVRKAAHKAIRDEEWLSEWGGVTVRDVESVLQQYEDGLTSGLYGRGKAPRFKPRTYDRFYIDSVDLESSYDGCNIFITVTNDATEQTGSEDLYLDYPPEIGYVEDAYLEEHYGPRSSQQSVIVRLEGEDGEADLQIDVDPRTGQVHSVDQWNVYLFEYDY